MRVPENEELEKSILSFLLSYEDKTEEYADKLNINDFNTELYIILITEIKRGNFNIESFIENFIIKYVDIESIIENIVLSKKKVSTIDHQIKRLKELSKYRRMIEFGEKICKCGYEKTNIPEAEYNDFLETLQTNLVNAKITSIYDEAKKYVLNYDKKIKFLKTGLMTLDRILKIERGDLIVVAARPSMGKTAFSIQMMLGFSFHNLKALAFSLEMKNSQLIQRVLANIFNVNLNKIRGKNLDEKEKNELVGRLDKHLMHLDFNLTDEIYSFNYIIETIRREKKRNGLDVVLIDFLQLMETEGKNRNQEIGHMSRVLKLLAKELDISIILLSQLNRALENRADRRPIMSDLRDSGEVEQNMDSCVFLYRDDYYNEDSEMQNILEAIVKKQRQGMLGTANLFFDREKQIIRDLA